jgi:hypothetical protein
MAFFSPRRPAMEAMAIIRAGWSGGSVASGRLQGQEHTVEIGRHDARQCASVSRWNGAASAIPALATQIVTGPRARAAAAIPSRTEVSSAHPSATGGAAAARRDPLEPPQVAPGDRHLRAALGQRLGDARPIPVPPPVTSACLPSNSIPRLPRCRSFRKLRSGSVDGSGSPPATLARPAVGAIRDPPVGVTASLGGNCAAYGGIRKNMSQRGALWCRKPLAIGALGPARN